MAILIDTNVFIAAERSRQSGRLGDGLSQLLSEGRREEEALISVITASELLIGVERADDSRIRERRIAFVEAIIDRFSTLAIDLRIARQHSRINAALMASGQIIGSHDSWIAASALTYGFAVATTNISEFSRVPGLRVIPINS